MKQITVTYRACGVDQGTLAHYTNHLKPEIERVTAAWGAGYTSDYASLGLSSDHAMRAQVRHAVDEKRLLKPTMLIVCGIGGSNLGAQALYEALGAIGATSPLPVCWADTVDATSIGDIYDRAEKELALGNAVILVIISKSGTTTETVANSQLFLALLERYKKKEMHKYVVVITDQDSALWKIAHKKEFARLAIPAKVGGRYSVFSAAGLFPLGMLGIDISSLVEGAQSMHATCTAPRVIDNSAALRAVILYEHYRRGMRVHDLFLFSPVLRGIGAWYRQLMGESIGKAVNRAGKVVETGIVPTVSIGSTDLHSVGQLYLSGPRISFTTFITVVRNMRTMTIPDVAGFDSLVPNLQKKSLDTIMHAIAQGTQQAYEHNRRPFVTLELPEISAYHGGQLLQLMMVEMMYLGFLLDINPFDQPQVELYKKETREILAHE